MTESKIAFSGSFWNVVNETDVDGRTHEYLNVDNSVLVIAAVPTGEVILVEVDRRPHRAAFTEFPGGGLDHGESVVDAAKRELIEETGYRGKEWSHAHTIVPSSAWSTERCYVVTAQGATRAAEVQSDDEVNTVELVHPDAVLSRLLAGGGDACAIAAWLLVAVGPA